MMPRPLAVLACLVLACGVSLIPCCRQERSVLLSQRAYIWQRDWKAPIVDSLREGRDSLDGCAVLAAEIEWHNGKPGAMRPDVNWIALREWRKPIGAAMRISPFPGPFYEDDENTRYLCTTAKSIVTEVGRQGVELTELQVDFDCAQKKLAGYALWVRKLRDAVKPVPLVITTLPSWLKEPEFVPLVREVPRYVLQVHSVSSPLGDAKTMICDPILARRWVAQATHIGQSFEIALPTYRSIVGYSADGKLLGVSSDGVRPSWPAGTAVREYETDPNAMAALVAEWKRKPPAHCKGLLWYRLPVITDGNNWRWPTLRAVMAGRPPRASWAAVVHGGNPADLLLLNDGESEAAWHGQVLVRWEGKTRVTAEALPGWQVKTTAYAAVFSPTTGTRVRLPPGGERAIGWFRLDPAIPFHAQIDP
jgi:hypothetical protein